MTMLYIAGPMTGLPEFNHPAFHEAERRLVAAGYAVMNPARNRITPGNPNRVPTWLDYMRMSLRQISYADGLALLDAWRTSRGATLEVAIADGLDLARRTVDYWVQAAATPIPGAPSGTDGDAG